MCHKQHTGFKAALRTTTQNARRQRNCSSFTGGLRKAEHQKMRQYDGHLLVNDDSVVGFMAVQFSAFGSTVPRGPKLFFKKKA